VNVPTVTGYQRDPDGSWDYFIDRAAGIAYLRIGQFNADTAAQFEMALRELKDKGCRGLIIDLRYNGGGRLDEAVQIADLFLDRGSSSASKGGCGQNRASMRSRATTIFASRSSCS
jgi:carboxyl-terminal processing protease